MPKILIIRFSSIGDIVLTTPVVRMAKQQIKDAEVHFLTKASFKPVVEANPYIDKCITVNRKLSEAIGQLREERYDFVVDLHNNLRTARVKRKLKVDQASFNKLNIEKWLLVNLKKNRMPDLHIVDRYLATLNSFGVQNDGKGLDYFIPESDEVDVNSLPDSHHQGYIAWVIGGSYFTKMFPTSRIIEVLRRTEQPFVLLGGPEDKERGDEIKSLIGAQVYNACGNYSLNQSASLVKQANKVISNDTGLMHIAAAFQKPILSIWGNTVPEFGMTPYMPENPSRSTILEIRDLRCRPCSKLGYKTKCPKKHFYCMELIETDRILTWIQQDFD